MTFGTLRFANNHTRTGAEGPRRSERKLPLLGRLGDEKSPGIVYNVGFEYGSHFNSTCDHMRRFVRSLFDFSTQLFGSFKDHDELEPVLDRTGKAVAMFDGSKLFDLTGSVVGNVTGSQIFAGGSLIGRVHRGLFLDSNEAVVGFLVGAVGGAPSTFSIRGGPPVVLPVASVLVPPKPWSSMSWDVFVRPSTSSNGQEQ